MKLSSRTVRLGASLVAALVAGGGTWRAVAQAKRFSGGGPGVPVLVVRRAVPAARSLTAADVEVRPVPAAFVESGAFHDLKELTGVRARVPLMKGEFVTRSKIESESSRLGLAWSLPPGLTALSLRLPPEAAVGGHALPGDWVRIIASSRSSAETLVPRARVMAVQERVWEPGGAPASPVSGVIANETLLVTLLLTPEQAVRTVSALDRGRLALALLSPIDEATAGDADEH